jgi:hypothetical protein
MQTISSRDTDAIATKLEKRESFKTHGALSGRSRTVTGHLPQTGVLPREFYDTVKDADYVVYSYATPIAWHVPGMTNWVFPGVKYSRTTSHHQSRVRNALRFV